MKTTSLLTKNLALGLATVGLATGASVLFSADSAQAIVIKYTLSGVTTSDGGTLSGSFNYNSDNPDLFENFNLSGTPGIAITSSTSYGAGAISPGPAIQSQEGPNTGTFLSVRSNNGTPRSALALEFSGDLTTASPGDSFTILPGTTGFNFNPSYELLQIDNRDSQARSVSGGLVTASKVPEPVTILGTLLAGGIGAAMKKRKGQLS